MGARLKPIDVATCGSLIFGRFPQSSGGCSLEDYLGIAFPILDAMSPKECCPRFVTECVHANWKFCFHITLDDYHPVAVHPKTLGKGGYVSRDQMSYVRIGHHSAYIHDADAGALEKLAQACREGIYEPYAYLILQIFPNLLVVHTVADPDHWRCSIQQHVPVTHHRSTFRGWSYPAPTTASRPWLRRIGDRVTEPIRARVFEFFSRQVVREDLRICENLQKVAGQVVDIPFLGRLEERIQWFEEAYRSIRTAEAAHEMDRADAL
jgi:phenylpropionate dioxygenase-like ring-hydroxylating dioxygenase large terminal subunit